MSSIKNNYEKEKREIYLKLLEIRELMIDQVNNISQYKYHPSIDSYGVIFLTVAPNLSKDGKNSYFPCEEYILKKEEILGFNSESLIERGYLIPFPDIESVNLFIDFSENLFIRLNEKFLEFILGIIEKYNKENSTSFSDIISNT